MAKKKTPKKPKRTEPAKRRPGKPPAEPQTALGRWIREARGDRSVQDLAAKAGISLRYWHHLEAGRWDNPREVVRRAIAAALGRPVEEMP